jgi:hypothetical protein
MRVNGAITILFGNSNFPMQTGVKRGCCVLAIFIVSPQSKKVSSGQFDVADLEAIAPGRLIVMLGPKLGGHWTDH